MRERVKAAVFTEAGKPLEIREYPVPVPEAGMAVVELVTSGICGTDVHIWEGALAMPRPVIPGHEFLGRVSALGADAEARDCMGEPVKVGDLVAVNVIEPCGKCLLCRTGGAASCLFLGESLTYTRSPDEPPHLYGGYAEATVCPIRYLHRLPDGLAPEVAAAFLCAGPTVIRAVTYGGGIGSREHVVVQGSGPVGLFATLWASHCGAASVTLIGSSSHPDRLVLARRLGATSVLDIRSTSEEQRRQTVFGITDGIGADVVIECSGSPNAVPEGLGLLRPRGRYLLPGQYSDRGPVPLPIHLVTLNALQLIGSAQFTSDDRQAYFAGLMQMSDRWDAITASITLRAPVSKADSALQAVRQGKAIKALLVPE